MTNSIGASSAKPIAFQENINIFIVSHNGEKILSLELKDFITKVKRLYHLSDTFQTPAYLPKTIAQITNKNDKKNNGFFKKWLRKESTEKVEDSVTKTGGVTGILSHHPVDYQIFILFLQK